MDSKRFSRRHVLTGALAIGAAGSLTSGVRAQAGRAAVRGPTIRVAALRYGSVQWLLEAITANGFDAAEGIKLDVRKLASSQAGQIALMAGEADIAVNDWPWAMRQLSKGEPFRFAPYNAALGAVMVAPDSAAKSLADLKGKRLGVAGSAIDKSWILIRAYAKKTIGTDLADTVTPVFGAPPLLAQEMKSGRLDAVLNFWTYSARLEGAGFRKLIGMDEVMNGLGVQPPPPMVGYIWSRNLEAKTPEAVPAFLAAAQKANDMLAKSDAAWDGIRPLMKARDDAEFEALKATFRSGIPDGWSPKHTQSAERLLSLLKDLGSADLIGANTTFDPSLFHGTA